MRQLIGAVVVAVTFTSGIAFWETRQDDRHQDLADDHVELATDYAQTKAEVAFERCVKTCIRACMAGGGGPQQCEEFCYETCAEEWLQ